MGLSKYYIRGYKKMLEKCAVFSAAPKNYVPNPNREGGDAAFASYYAIDPELAKKYSDSVINRDYHQAQMDDSFWTYPWHWIAHSSNANDADSARAEIARGAILLPAVTPNSKNSWFVPRIWHVREPHIDRLRTRDRGIIRQNGGVPSLLTYIRQNLMMCIVSCKR